MPQPQQSQSWLLESRGVPESCWSSVCIEIPKQGLTPVKERLMNSIDEFAGESKDKQTTTTKAFLFHVLLCGLPPKGVTKVSHVR